MDEFTQPVIQEALALSPSELVTKLSKPDAFIHSLASHTWDQVTAILLAGRDTTAATLSWTFLELVRNPEVSGEAARRNSRDERSEWPATKLPRDQGHEAPDVHHQ